jgi:hypothetical protein
MDHISNSIARNTISNMHMQTTFNMDYRVTILFSGWKTTTISQYILTLLFLFLLAILNRFLGVLRFQLRKSRYNRFSNLVPSPIEASPYREHYVHKAKASPLPQYAPLADEEDLTPKPLPLQSDRNDEIDRNKEHRFARSYHYFTSWETLQPWRLSQDGLGAVLELTRALVGYVL